jgi:PAS domain S-box-containing protein
MPPDSRSIVMAMIPAKPRATPRGPKQRTGARTQAPAAKSPALAADPGTKGAALPAELAESILGAINEGLIVFGLDGRPIYCNDRAVEITGVTLEQRLAMTPAELAEPIIREDGSAETEDSLPSQLVLQTGERQAVTHGLRTPDGRLVWVDTDAVPIFRAGGRELSGCCLVMRDVTERRAATEALRASDELKSAIVAASVDAILTIDAGGKIVDLNRAAELLYKTTRAAVGDTLESFIPWRDRQTWAEILEQLRSDPKHFRDRRLTGIGRRSDGSEFPLEATIDSLDADGHQLFVTFVRDVTERRAAERRLADARDAALRASVVKSEFLATMSHEIRTPMNGVIGSLDLILDSDLADDLRDLATIARTSAHDLLAIIDDILDLSKIEADKLDSQAIEFDLAAIVEGVTDIVAVPARRKGLSLSCFVDPRAPRAVRGDARLLRQVLVNLVGNAVKFTDTGEVAIRAEVQSADDARVLVQFAVSDTGIGIPPEATETLFEPFTQVDGSSTRAHGGTGLGLAISSRLVRLMGGHLAVDSAVGRGSTFSFTVAFEIPERSPGPAYAPNPQTRPLRVIVVESTPSAAETIDRYLRAWGMVTTRTANAREAIERFNAAREDEPFDVAVIAVTPGDEAAADLARELHTLAGDEGLFVIALIEVGERIADAALARGQIFDAVVAKPIKQSRLYDALASVDPAAAAPETPDLDAAPVTELRGLRILIAEDNRVNQQVLLRQAGRLGLVASAVENGQAALDALAEGKYDAVLMDCQMPVMDGYAATRAIRERERKGAARTPVVAVTANAMREDYERCRDAGMDDFVAKPVTLAALASALERAVGASRAGGTADAMSGELTERADELSSLDAYGIDPAALAALQEDVGGAASLGRIIRLFLEQLDPQIQEILEAAGAGEHERMARTAHRMKSSSATLGATRLADVLERLETAGIDADGDAVEQLITGLESSVERTRSGFEAVFEGLAAAN